LREILRDDRRLLRERKFDGGLAGREAFGRKTQAAASAREFYFQGASGIGFEQKAAIGVRDRDGMVQHVAEHHVQGELRVQQGSGLQQALQLDEAAARRLRAGDVLDPSEEIRERGFRPAGIRTEKDLVRIVDAESDGIAVLKLRLSTFSPLTNRPRRCPRSST